MGLLKYTFDNKISVTNKCNAVQRGEFPSIQILLPMKKYELWILIPSSSPLESFFASPQPSLSFIIQDGGISDYSSLSQQNTPALQYCLYCRELIAAFL